MATDHRPRTQFSLRRLMVSVLMVAAALAIMCYAGRPDDDAPQYFILWFVGGALVGAGVANPFGYWQVGMFFGLLAAFVAAEIISQIEIQHIGERTSLRPTVRSQ